MRSRRPPWPQVKADLVYTFSGTRRVQMVWVTRDGEETLVDPEFLPRSESIALHPRGERIALSLGERESSGCGVVRKGG